MWQLRLSYFYRRSSNCSTMRRYPFWYVIWFRTSSVKKVAVSKAFKNQTVWHNQLFGEQMFFPGEIIWVVLRTEIWTCRSKAYFINFLFLPKDQPISYRTFHWPDYGFQTVAENSMSSLHAHGSSTGRCMLWKLSWIFESFNIACSMDYLMFCTSAFLTSISAIVNIGVSWSLLE